jgi:hypothetical protein
VTRLADSLILAAIISALGLGSCLDACGTRAEAQSRATRDERAVAVCLLAEDERGTDWPSILDVLERRAAAHGMTPGAVSRVYCAVHRAARPSARQLRLRALPGGNPSPRIAALYEAALAAARRGGPGTCGASHWGAASGEDHARAVRAGWRRVTGCGERNAFWSER